MIDDAVLVAEVPMSVWLVMGNNLATQVRAWQAWCVQFMSSSRLGLLLTEDQYIAFAPWIDDRLPIQVEVLQVGCVCCTLKNQVEHGLVRLRQAGVTHLWLQTLPQLQAKAMWLQLAAIPWVKIQSSLFIDKVDAQWLPSMSVVRSGQLTVATEVLLVYQEEVFTEPSQQVLQQLRLAQFPAKRYWQQQVETAVIEPDGLFASVLSSLPDACSAYWPAAVIWSRVCLKRQLQQLDMRAYRQVIAVLRTGPQHWYWLRWDTHLGWQWQESSYAGDQYLCAYAADETIYPQHHWQQVMRTCQHKLPSL